MLKYLLLLLFFSCAQETPSVLSGGGVMTEDFDSLSPDFWLVSNGYSNGGVFNCDWDSSHATTGAGVLTLKLDNSPRAYTCGEIRSKSKFSAGRFDVRMRAAAAPGIVSSFFLYSSAPHDEIDIEFLGKDPTKMQVNYFKNGVGNHEVIIDLGFDASAADHTYGIEWRETFIKWYVDGRLVHTVTGNSSTLPTEPGHLYMNIWNGIGVDAWLGTFSYSVPLSARYDQVKIGP